VKRRKCLRHQRQSGEMAAAALSVNRAGVYRKQMAWNGIGVSRRAGKPAEISMAAWRNPLSVKRRRNEGVMSAKMAAANHAIEMANYSAISEK